jgi:hypothetical protein
LNGLNQQSLDLTVISSLVREFSHGEYLSLIARGDGAGDLPDQGIGLMAFPRENVRGIIQVLKVSQPHQGQQHLLTTYPTSHTMKHEALGQVDGTISLAQKQCPLDTMDDFAHFNVLVVHARFTLIVEQFFPYERLKGLQEWIPEDLIAMSGINPPGLHDKRPCQKLVASQ